MKTAVCLTTLLAVGDALVPRGGQVAARRGAVRAAAAAAAVAAPVAADLSGLIPDCPLTVWDADDIDLKAARAKPAMGKTCPLEWASSMNGAEDAAFFASKREEVHQKLLEHGCVWFRGFDLMKSTEGFRAFYEALDLDPCLDPIHTSGLRKFASQENAVYEEVNKPSLRQHFIGLHQESTHKKTAKFGAFVCFKPATVRGGEFFVADAAKILRELDLDVAERLYDRKIRISVSNLDLDFLNAVPAVKEPLMEGFKGLVDKFVAPKFDMGLEMVFGADGKPMRLQAVEEIASPVNRHPVTKEPLWFCNIHNHARYLRDNRPCSVPEVGMTEVYYGDLSKIEAKDLDHINEVSQTNIVNMLMQPGDVVLVDNYRVLHGRDIFDGDRFHAVSWFGGRASESGDKAENANAKPGNFLNQVVNKYLVDSF